MMGLRGGGFRSRLTFVAASVFAFALSGCASGPASDPYDLAAAKPPPAHAVRAQFRVGQATATADLDSDHILVRESQTLATLAGARWPEPLPALFRARLTEVSRTRGSPVGSTARRRLRITKSISTSAPSSSTLRRRKSISTSPPGSSRLAAGGSWRTRFSPCGRLSRRPTLQTSRRRWIKRRRPS